MIIHEQAVSRENNDKLLENKTQIPLGKKKKKMCMETVYK